MLQEAVANHACDEACLGVQSLHHPAAAPPTQEVQSMISLRDDIMNLRPCVYATDSAVFLLEDVAQNTELTSRISSAGDQQIMEKTVGQNTVRFNFCEKRPTDNNLPAACQSKPDAYAYAWSMQDTNTCRSVLANDAARPNIKAEDVRPNSTEAIAGLRLVYESDSTKCPSDEQKTLTLKVEISCTEQGDTKLTFDGSETGDDVCDITLKYKSGMGCPTFQYGILAQFISKYSYLLGAVMIVFGLLLAFCGNKFLTIVIGIVTCLATIVFGVYLTSRFVDEVWQPESIKD